RRIAGAMREIGSSRDPDRVRTRGRAGGDRDPQRRFGVVALGVSRQLDWKRDRGAAGPAHDQICATAMRLDMLDERRPLQVRAGTLEPGRFERAAWLIVAGWIGNTKLPVEAVRSAGRRNDPLRSHVPVERLERQREATEVTIFERLLEAGALLLDVAAVHA